MTHFVLFFFCFLLTHTLSMSFFVRATKFIRCDIFSQCFIFLSVFENAASGENEWVGISSFPTMNLKEKNKREQNNSYINNSKIYKGSEVSNTELYKSLQQAWSYPQVWKRRCILNRCQNLNLLEKTNPLT